MPRHGDMLWRLHLATSEAALSLKMFLTLQSPNETWSFQQFFAIDVRSIVYNSPLFNTHVYFCFHPMQAHVCATQWSVQETATSVLPHAERPTGPDIGMSY